MACLTSTVQIFILLLFPTKISPQKDFKIDSFELQVLNNKNAPVNTYNLIKVQAITLQPNTRFNFKCTVSGLPTPYVVIIYKNTFNRTDQQRNKTYSSEVEYRIETVDCHHSGSYTCRVGNNQGFKNITTNIVIECPVTEARFVSNKIDHYVAISKDQENLLMICEERELSNTLTLFNQRNRSYRLNYVEHSYKITYNIPKVTCSDMGTYVCVLNRTNTHQLTNSDDAFVNVMEMKMDLFLNNCPPQYCHKSVWNLIQTLEPQTKISLTVCVEVSIGTRVFAVFYLGSWVSNGTCGKKICLESTIKDRSRFQHQLNITLKNIDTALYDDIIIRIGSGYNYQINYINHTISIRFNNTRKEFLGTINNIIWIPVSLLISVYLICTTIIIGVFFYYLKKKKQENKALVTMASYNRVQQTYFENTYESVDLSLQTHAQRHVQEQSMSTVENYVAYVNASPLHVEPSTSLKQNLMSRCWKN